MLLAEGWNSPRATVCMHLAPTASRRVYQQRIGRIMRTHPRKEAGIVVDFVPKAATHNERVVSLHSLLDADFYREGARVTPAPRRRIQRRARRKLTPAPWLVPVTPDVRRRLAVITREWQRVDPKYLDEDEQRYWATIAGRQMRFDERAAFVEKLTARGASKARLEKFLDDVRGREPEPPAADDRALRPRLDDGRARRLRRPRHARDAGAAVGEGPHGRRAHPAARDRRGQGRRAGPDPRALDVAARARVAQAAGPQAIAEYPEAKRLLGALANSRGHRHEENAAKLVNAALEMPLQVGAALLASAEGYTPRATQLIEAARERLGTMQEVAGALAENLPAAEAHRRPFAPAEAAQAAEERPAQQPAAGRRPRRTGSTAEAAPAEPERNRLKRLRA